MTRKLYIGADVSAATIDVAWQCDGQRQGLGQFANNPQGFAEMVAQLASVLAAPETAVYLILEPTGGHELALVAFAHHQG
jgi:H+/Cl- antiporter ClcA